jgi:multidrug efflux pump subunit AcrA (membrane-fusion protein)
VPASAVVRDAEGATQVFIYTSDDRRVHARRITPGVVVGGEVEITSGLGRGELVVVGGQHQLREGMTARLVAANARGSVPGRLQ